MLTGTTHTRMSTPPAWDTDRDTEIGRPSTTTEWAADRGESIDY